MVGGKQQPRFEMKMSLIISASAKRNGGVYVIKITDFAQTSKRRHSKILLVTSIYEIKVEYV